MSIASVTRNLYAITDIYFIFLVAVDPNKGTILIILSIMIVIILFRDMLTIVIS